MNRRIRVPEVRVIGADGAQLGMLDTSRGAAHCRGGRARSRRGLAQGDAAGLQDHGLRQVQVRRLEEAQGRQEAPVDGRPTRRSSSVPRRTTHDLRLQGEAHPSLPRRRATRRASSSIFRGREIVHPETGQAMLKTVVELTQDIAMVEQPPMMEGRRMLMIIAPRGGVINRPAACAGHDVGARTGGRRCAAASGDRSRRPPAAHASRPQPAKPAQPTVSVKPPAKISSKRQGTRSCRR